MSFSRLFSVPRSLASDSTSWTRGLAFGLAALLSLQGTLALAATEPYGGESPQAVVERMKAAAETEDLGEMAACLAPQDRAALSLTMVLVTGMVMAFASMGAGMGEAMGEAMEDAMGEMTEAEKQEMAQKKAEADAQVEEMQGRYEAILEKHGLSGIMDADSELGADGDPEAALEGVDQVALLEDMMGFLESLPGEEGESAESAPMDVPTGDLTDLAVDGDKATGMLGDEEVEFVKVDGRWYVSLNLKEKLQQEQGGMAP
jgi:hypothetical protein